MKKTYYKQIVENCINTSKINIIKLVIINLETKKIYYIKNFLYIYCCQVAKYDYLDKNNFENIKENIVTLQKKIIC